MTFEGCYKLDVHKILNLKRKHGLMQQQTFKGGGGKFSLYFTHCECFTKIAVL